MSMETNITCHQCWCHYPYLFRNTCPNCDTPYHPEHRIESLLAEVDRLNTEGAVEGKLREALDNINSEVFATCGQVLEPARYFRIRELACTGHKLSKETTK